jgi:peptidoglycan/xylan/chitin deacetylase (PgdA/CDA1 family)
MRRALTTLAALGAGVAAALPAAGLAAQNHAPAAAIRSASVTQDGQQLVWKVRLAAPFWTSNLASEHRSLCLSLAPRAGSAAKQVCVAGPARHSRAPRLEYVTPRHVTMLDATVTRGDRMTALTARFLPTDIGLRYRSVRWQVASTATASACGTAASTTGSTTTAPGSAPAPVTCTLTFPAKPALTRLHVPRLVGCVSAGPEYVFHGPTDQRVVALTFDDGPWYDTAQFLDILERARVPATFFEVGDEVSVYGQRGAIERRMLADGDMIGDHTWDHADVAAGGAFARAEITRAADAIRAVSGFQPCLFRAPYGATSPALISDAHALGFTTIQWNVDPQDWARPGVSAIYDNVIANAHGGAIILQHDGGGDRSETLAALPQEIATLKREGYRFETITDLLGLRLIYK